MTIKAVDQEVTDQYAIYQGDACELIRAIPGESVHFGIHSPPFEGLYKFSNFDRGKFMQCTLWSRPGLVTRSNSEMIN